MKLLVIITYFLGMGFFSVDVFPPNKKAKGLESVPQQFTPNSRDVLHLTYVSFSPPSLFLPLLNPSPGHFNHTPLTCPHTDERKGEERKGPQKI